MKYTIFLTLLLLTLFSCQSPSKSWISMKIIQDKPQLHFINLRDSSLNEGDGLTYEAVLRDTSGKQIGEIHGWTVTVDLSDPEKERLQATVDKIGTLVLNIEGEDIIGLGEVGYSEGKSLINEGQAQRRAILGGTGKFKGIYGEIKTTRNSDSTYTHELSYKLQDQ